MTQKSKFVYYVIFCIYFQISKESDTGEDASEFWEER